MSPCEPQVSDITHFVLRLLKDISRNIFLSFSLRIYRVLDKYGVSFIPFMAPYFHLSSGFFW